MKTRILILSIVLLSSTFSVFSQTSNQLNPNIDQFGTIKEMPLKPAEIKGSVYLNEEWAKGNITLVTGAIIENVPLK